MRSESLKRHLLRGSAALALLLAIPPVIGPSVAAPVEPGTQPLVVGAPDFSALVARVAPAVVAITVTQDAAVGEEGLARDPRSPFGIPRGNRDGEGRNRDGEGRGGTRAVGSGFIVDTDGYIITNHHVVERARSVLVVLADGKSYPAKVIGTDQRTDLALLKVDAGRPLPAVALGDSDQVKPGQWVVAVGNPFGLGGTVTAGIVSARSRVIGGQYDDYLQIDAPINQGNSGGPSFDINGNVVGVNTAIYSPSGGSVGVGFAIPSNLVKQIVADLKNHGRVDRGWLGVSMQDISASMARALGMGEATGALVVEVEPSGPAARAGIRRGDVILSVDGKTITDGRMLSRHIAALQRGQKSDIVLWRDGQKVTQPVTIGRMADRSAAAGGPSDEGRPGVGFVFAHSSDRAGALVARVQDDSPADQAGFKRGDLIVEIDKTKIESPAEAIEKLSATRKQNKSAVAVLVEREGRMLYLGLTFEPSKS
jgi:serine protease Do